DEFRVIAMTAFPHRIISAMASRIPASLEFRDTSFISRQNRRANDQFLEFGPDNTADQACHAANSSSNAFASFRSSVSNPSVNHPYTGAGSSRTSCTFPWSRHSRARLIAEWSSGARATAYARPQALVLARFDTPRASGSNEPNSEL